MRWMSKDIEWINSKKNDEGWKKYSWIKVPEVEGEDLSAPSPQLPPPVPVLVSTTLT